MKLPLLILRQVTNELESNTTNDLQQINITSPKLFSIHNASYEEQTLQKRNCISHWRDEGRTVNDETSVNKITAERKEERVMGIFTVTAKLVSRHEASVVFQQNQFHLKI